MIVYLISDTSEKEYRIPRSAEDGERFEILLGENGGKVNKAVLKYVGGSWELVRRRGMVLTVQGQEFTRKKLELNDLIQISCGSAQYLLYVTDVRSGLMRKYRLTESKITVGTEESNTIVYKAPLVSKKHLAITIEENAVTAATRDKHGILFVNGTRTQSAVLAFGDIITVMGLKLVYLDRLLAVNDPEGLVECRLEAEKQQVPEDSMTPAADAAGEDPDEEPENEDKKETNYFQRSPRIIKALDTVPLQIDPPPPQIKDRQQPAFLRLGPSMLMGIAMLINTLLMLYTPNQDPASFIGRLAMSGAMLAGMILWPVMTSIYQKIDTAAKERKRIRRYRQYMKKKFGEMEERTENNCKVLLLAYPDPAVCINRIANMDRRIWERMPLHDDFLAVRLGSGTIPNPIRATVPEDHFTMEDDYLLDELKEVNKAFLFMRDVPIHVSLRENKILGLIGDRRMLLDLAMSLIVQITALHCYDEVKLFVIYPEHEEDKWEWVRHLPHVWAPGKSARYVARNSDEVKEVFMHLNSIVRQREEAAKESEGKAVPKLPHIVVLIADSKLAENQPVMRYLTSLERDYGVSSILLYEQMGLLPKECSAFVQCTETGCSLYHRDKPDAGMVEFKPDSLAGHDLMKFSRQMAAIKIKEDAATLSIPSSLTFLEMYRVGSVEQLDIKRRWRENHAYKSLEAPLGYMAGEVPFYLNIHEKFHGPHGLIAGMTGSGKSEFIISFLLSLAVNYHPYEVSFILIDYKGGGMANCFEGLAHVSGTITNLSGNQVYRSLVSIKSELKRRQSIFAQYGVNHIDKYQQLYINKKAKEPLPHLLIISDEFAELKSQQPEFMDELVSAARIGRSLGVHLVLATQKPAGVVNDQIWSNTRFRICLKVLDRSDSVEMLKKPDAASIVQPGRCYVQVGNDEIYELVQASWSGAPYIPGDRIESDEEKQVCMIDTCGRPVRIVSCKKATEKGAKTQQEAVVEHIKELCAKDALKPLRLWLEPLRETIFLDEADTRPGGWNGEGWDKVDHWLEPVIGMVDDPYRQTQFPLVVNIGEEGHLILYGAPGTGKTTFLQTFIYSLVKSYTPDDINIYILDLGGRTMGYFCDLPHVGGVVFADDADKLEKLLKMLNRELENRKKTFSEIGVGNIRAYMEATGRKIPVILLVIDNYSVFSELFDDYENMIVTFSRDGGNYGIYLVITGSSIDSVKSRIMQNVRLLMTLQLNDRYDYFNVVGKTEILPDSVKGRGLVKGEPPLEFQTALALKADNDADRVSKLRGIFREMRARWKGNMAKPIPFVPEKITIEEFCSNESVRKLINAGELPFAFDTEEAEPVTLPRNESSYVILGYDHTGKTNLLRVLIRIMGEAGGYRVYVVDNSKKQMAAFCRKNMPEGYIDSSSRLEELLDHLNRAYMAAKEAAAAGESDSEEAAEVCAGREKTVVLVDDFCNFFDMLSETHRSIVEDMVSGVYGSDILFVFTANPYDLSMYRSETLYRYVFNGMYGVLLGGRVDSQDVFEPDMSYRERDMQFEPGNGYMFEKNGYKTIRVPEM
jgi:S-DNA-T family DNA segregation ATPase FtsK/SpoIIIE